MSQVTDIKIKKLQVRAVRVPMSVPHQTASGVITESPLVLVDLFTDRGVVGHSIAFTYTPIALKPVADLIANMSPLLEQQQLAPTAIYRNLEQKFRLLGNQGLIAMALAAIDMAIWDALAKVLEAPLYKVLGGAPEKIPAYGAIGFDGVAESARSAGELAAAGFTGIKAKIGYPSVADDIRVIQAMRRAAGDDIAIMVDYNQSLDRVEACQRLSALAHEGLTWVEEPVLAHDFRAYSDITDSSTIPIQAGENWWGILDMEHSLRVKGSDLVMPDVMKIGGVTGWMKAAALSAAKGIPQSNHLWPELSTHLLCCAASRHWLEYCDWWNPILKTPLQIKEGLAMVSADPGSGILWNEKAIQEYSL